MGAQKRKNRGVALVELMVAIVFLGVCAGSLMSAITNTNTNVATALDRQSASSALQSELEKVKAAARSGSLSTGSFFVLAASVSRVPISVTKQISLVAGYTDLYKVQLTATWTDSVVKQRRGSVVLVTYVRAPYG